MDNYVTSKLLENDDINHGFFTRNAGVSTGLYNSLNIAYSSSDNPDNILENRKIIAKDMGINVDNLVILQQIHSNIVHVIDEPFNSREEVAKGDALVTNKTGIAIAVMTADCVPVIFADDKNKIVGVAHAGWGGAISGVLENTIKSMQELGADINNIKAAIGPCIGRDSYEVGLEFYQRFINESNFNSNFFIKSSKTDKYYFDISAFVAYKLSNSGIKNIDMLDIDTLKNEDKFFSYRRSCIRKEEDYGRQLSVVVVR